MSDGTVWYGVLCSCRLRVAATSQIGSKPSFFTLAFFIVTCDSACSLSLSLSPSARGFCFCSHHMAKRCWTSIDGSLSSVRACVCLNMQKGVGQNSFNPYSDDVLHSRRRLALPASCRVSGWLPFVRGPMLSMMKLLSCRSNYKQIKYDNHFFPFSCACVCVAVAPLPPLPLVDAVYACGCGCRYLTSRRLIF